MHSYRAVPARLTLSHVMVAVPGSRGLRRTVVEMNSGGGAARVMAMVPPPTRQRVWVGGIEHLASKGGVLVRDVVDADKALVLMVPG